MSHVLIVDDEESICWGLKRLLTETGHEVGVAASAEDALRSAAARAPDLVVMDVRLPGMDGLAAMEPLVALTGPIPIVVMTAFGNLDIAVRAMRNGAFDYLAKPFDLEQAAAVIDRALAHKKPAAARLAPNALALEQEMLGQSAVMQEVFKRIALVAPTDASVLITGESGTGKELVARAIHRHSTRAARAFVPIHLASLSPTLVESELFGHVRGAFTGADEARQGLLELAGGATVFFDEAGDSAQRTGQTAARARTTRSHARRQRRIALDELSRDRRHEPRSRRFMPAGLAERFIFSTSGFRNRTASAARTRR